jgi:pimeloyl-ACP methyl ester carboxylesterase
VSGPSYDVFDVPVDGGDLRVGRWTASDPHAPVVLAVHGVTANHLAWQFLGALDRFTVVAPDLRGRGRSGRLVGAAGMEQHARDLVALLDRLDTPAPLLVGHSMGGFVATALVQLLENGSGEAVAGGQGAGVAGTVLVDGGLPFPPLPAGVTTDQALAATIGPAAQRLTMTFPTPGDYLDFWRPHPALADHWSTELEAYFAYDLEGTRSSVSLDAVREDSEGLLDPDATARWAAALPSGTVFLRAPRGMVDDPGGLYPLELMEQHRTGFPQVTARDVPGTNHYTIVMSEPGARAVADALDGTLDRPGS